MPGIELGYFARAANAFSPESLFSQVLPFYVLLLFLTFFFDSPDASVLDKKHNDVVRGDPSGGYHPYPTLTPVHRMSTNGEKPRKAACQGLHQPRPTRTLAPWSHRCHFTSMGCSFKVASHYPAQGHLGQKTPLPFPSPQCQTC